MQRKYKPHATEIDGEAGEEAICNMFAGKYEDLNNSVPFEQDQMEGVLQELNAQVRTSPANTARERNVTITSESRVNT